MTHMKFDPAKIAKLDDPARLEDLRPHTMWEALGAPSAKVIVEIGSGTGLMAEAFAALAPDAVVYAVDTEQAMLDWTVRVRSGLVVDGRLVPVLSEETSVPLPDSMADLVVMINLHHELADPIATYREAVRLLAEGGAVLVVDWKKAETPKGPPLAVRADEETIRRALVETGFSQILSHEGLPYHTMTTGRRDVATRS